MTRLVRMPLHRTPQVIHRPRPFQEIYARRQQDRIEQMGALLRHKDTLLIEAHHRIGNSLQLIASILALDAKKVHAGEARLHLRNAHRRVLAVAAVQQQLQSLRVGEDIELDVYFRQLCENLTASLVGDTRRIAIDFRGDAGAVTSAVAVSMGLIVAELVINALKYAFVGNRSTGGRILVTCRAVGVGWRLTVADDGVGNLPRDQFSTGVGTAVVAALVGQLGARIETSVGPDGAGTSISITTAANNERIASSRRAAMEAAGTAVGGARPQAGSLDW